MMTRNLKALGLALVAVFAMSAMIASAASADQFVAEKKPITLTGNQEGIDVFTVDGGEVKCKIATYHATVASLSVTEITATPHYTECTFAGIVPVTIDMNTCDYVFTIEGGAGTKGWVDIKCTKVGGDSITVTVNPAAHGLTEKCLIHIPEQTIGGVTYTNVGAKGPTSEVTVAVNTKTITYSQTEGSGLGHCETKDNTNNGTYVGTALVTGEEDTTTTHVGIRVE